MTQQELGGLGLAACGGIATAPLVVSICGWVAHWNAYGNLLAMLGSVVLWLTLAVSMRGVTKQASSR